MLLRAWRTLNSDQIENRERGIADARDTMQLLTGSRDRLFVAAYLFTIYVFAAKYTLDREGARQSARYTTA